MNIVSVKRAVNIALCTAIAVTVAHLIWIIAYSAAGRFAVDVQSMLLNILPYGIPIAAFALSLRLVARAEKMWGISDVVFFSLILLTFVAMALHVTIEGVIGDFIAVYFNVPIVYAIPLAAIGIVWLIVRARPRGDLPKVGKILYFVPIAVLAAMVVHCGILSAVALSRMTTTTGASWWVIPLAFGLLYLLVAFVLFGVYALYKRRALGRIEAGANEA